MKRRKYLTLAAGGVVALSGCPGLQQPETATKKNPDQDSQSKGSVQTNPTSEVPSQATDSTQKNTRTKTPRDLPSPLEVNDSNPFIYLNDIPPDNYNGELALAMASDDAGINLKGYLHEFPNVPWWDSTKKQTQARKRYIKHHKISRQKAEKSGFSNLPPAEMGLHSRHEKPDSERIDDTDPIGSAATERIVSAASDASPKNPLVITAGGPMCTVADAYLTDPSIANKVVIFCRIRPEVDGWNEFLSGWSLTVVVRRFQTVFCPASGAPLIKRTQVKNTLPDEPLREYMLEKVYEGTGKNPLADGKKWAADAVSLLSAAHPESRKPSKSLEFKGLKEHWKLGTVLPSFTETEAKTTTRVIPEHRHGRMNSIWWNHMSAPSTWGHND